MIKNKIGLIFDNDPSALGSSADQVRIQF